MATGASRRTHPGVDDQVGLHVELLQVGVPQGAGPVLHLVRPVQVLQRGLRDVHTAERGRGSSMTGRKDIYDILR